jgi:hypothetical protein
MTGYTLLRKLILSLVIVLTAVEARAQLIAYEAFNYPSPGSPLLGNNGGTGFSSAWRAGGFAASVYDNFQLDEKSLAFGALRTTGQSVSTATLFSDRGGVNRQLSQPIGRDGTTVYLSFLVRPLGRLNAGYSNGFFGLCLNSTGPDSLFIGKPGAGSLDQYVLENRGSARQVSSGAHVVMGETVFLVLRADFLAGPDRFALYVNPEPGKPEPAVGTVKSDLDVFTVDKLVIYSTGAFSIDEIRLGTTFADVTPAGNQTAGLDNGR